MQPNTEPQAHDPSLPAEGPPAVSAALQELLRRVAACSRDDKRILLDRVLRDLIGDQPDKEYGMYNPDGSAYIFLVPPLLRIQFDLTPERLAELDRSRASGISGTVSELIARLQSLE